jgi:hypothetical protein
MTMKRRMPANLGLVLAGVWFILTGLTGLLNLTFDGLGLVSAVLALVAGVLIVLKR